MLFFIFLDVEKNRVWHARKWRLCEVHYTKRKQYADHLTNLGAENVPNIKVRRAKHTETWTAVIGFLGCSKKDDGISVCDIEIKAVPRKMRSRSRRILFYWSWVIPTESLSCKKHCKSYLWNDEDTIWMIKYWRTMRTWRSLHDCTTWLMDVSRSWDRLRMRMTQEDVCFCSLDFHDIYQGLCFVNLYPVPVTGTNPIHLSLCVDERLYKNEFFDVKNEVS